MLSWVKVLLTSYRNRHRLQTIDPPLDEIRRVKLNSRHGFICFWLLSPQFIEFPNQLRDWTTLGFRMCCCWTFGLAQEACVDKSHTLLHTDHGLNTRLRSPPQNLCGQMSVSLGHCHKTKCTSKSRNCRLRKNTLLLAIKARRTIHDPTQG